MATILVVEDDQSLREALAYNLRREGHAVFTAEDAPNAVTLAHTERPDLVLLDLMLPGGSGLDVCGEIRSFSTAPIIMLTARGEDIDRVVGLEVGADDYVTKPFSIRELSARIKANLRRVEMDRADHAGQIVRHGDLVADVAGRRVQAGERQVSLQPKEFDLLVYLMRHPRKVQSRERLLRSVWGHEFVGGRTVDVHVRRLRAKLAGTPHADVIRTVHGVGYAFEPSE